MCCEASTLTPLLRRFIWMFEFRCNLQYTFIIICIILQHVICFYKLIMLRGWTLFSKRSQASLVTETMRAQRDGHMPLPARGLALVRGLTPSESSWVGIVIQRIDMIEIDWTWNMMKHDETIIWKQPNMHFGSKMATSMSPEAPPSSLEWRRRRRWSIPGVCRIHKSPSLAFLCAALKGLVEFRPTSVQQDATSLNLGLF